MPPSPIFQAQKNIKTYRAGTKTSALNLGGLGLQQDDLIALKDELSSLPRLKTLYLGKDTKSRSKKPATNFLDKMPEWLFETNPGLKKIDLSFNRLSELPSSVSTYPGFKHLDLKANKFARFPDVVCRMCSLAFLDLSLNAIQVLPQELGTLASLEDLVLDFEALRWPPPETAQTSEPTSAILSFLRTISARGFRSGS